jgi:hypothetical protein
MGCGYPIGMRTAADRAIVGRGKDGHCWPPPPPPRTDPYVQRYCIRLLPWVSGEKTHAWLWMHKPWVWYPACQVLSEAIPVHASLLTAAAKGMKPTSTYRSMEALHRVPVAGYVVVIVVTTNHCLEPTPCFINRLMSFGEEFLADFRQFGSKPFRDRRP